MGMDREAGEDISEIKGVIYKRTGVSSTKSRQKNENGSIYIRLYSRRCFIYRV